MKVQWQVTGFQPQFHHIFPKKFLESQVDPELVDALANIAIIGPSINIRISKQNPMNYIPKYTITAEKLRQQMISGQITTTSVDQYPDWLHKRAEVLAAKANEFFEELRGNLKLPATPVDAGKQDDSFAAA